MFQPGIFGGEEPSKTFTTMRNMMLTGGLPMAKVRSGHLLTCPELRELLRIIHCSLVLTHNPQMRIRKLM